MNAVQKINARFQELLQTTIFDIEPSQEWAHSAKGALIYGSLSSMQISVAEYEETYLAITEEKPLTLFQFATISNNLEVRTPQDLCLGLKDFIDLMRENEGYVKQWNEIVNKLKEQAKNEVSEEEKMLKAASENPLQAVKAEA